MFTLSQNKFYNLSAVFYPVAVFLLPYACVLNYMVIIRVWFLALKIFTGMVFSFKKLCAYGIFRKIFTRMGFFKSCMRTVFACLWVFQIWCPYLYYTLTIAVWGQIFNNKCTVTKKIPQGYGFPYQYGDYCTSMVILRVWSLPYTKYINTMEIFI